MELLVYARNYRDLGSSADAPSHRDLGAVVGEPAPPFSWGERLCSFVEVRMPMTVVDPTTDIELLIAKSIAAWGHPGAGRVLRFDNVRGRVAMLLEPGFERARDLCNALRPVLPRVRTMLERTTAPPPRPRSAAPVMAVAAYHDRARPLRVSEGSVPLSIGALNRTARP